MPSVYDLKPRFVALLRPVAVDAVVGDPVPWPGHRAQLTSDIESAVRGLGAHLPRMFEDE